jgi:hypothetical protein
MSTAEQLLDEGSKAKGRGGLWFGLLGGACAWTIHLMLAYGTAEFGCVGGFGERSYQGISVVAWLVLALTATCGLVAAAATVVAYRQVRRSQSSNEEGQRSGFEDQYLAHLGWLTSGAFTFIIFFESIPILFYLHGC